LEKSTLHAVAIGSSTAAAARSDQRHHIQAAGGIENGQEYVCATECVVLATGDEGVEHDGYVKHDFAFQAADGLCGQLGIVGLADDPIRRINHTRCVSNLSVATDGAVIADRLIGIVGLLCRCLRHH